jgi:acyl carrier protein
MTGPYERMSTILATRFDVEPDAIRPEATLDALDLDSLSRVELALLLKDEFGVVVDDEGTGEILPYAELLVDGFGLANKVLRTIIASDDYLAHYT